MDTTTNSGQKSIGYVVAGNLKDCLRVRLTVPAQDVQEGSFVVIRSNTWQFYGLITDLELGSTDPRFADEPAHERFQPAVSDLLQGQTLYTTLEVLSTLMMEVGPDSGGEAYKTWLECGCW